MTMRLPLLLGMLLLIDARLAGAMDETPLPEVLVTAPEPRYVAPTTRDSIGRIWAPVYINDRGPYRLVLDTGATSSGVVAAVAQELNLPLDKSPPIQLRGVTGTAVVPTVLVDSLVMGDLMLKDKKLAIITDALGGAQGILGNEGLADKRILIDFRRDQITVSRSHGERAAEGFLTVPVEIIRNRLLAVNALVGRVKVKAIIDTGGQATLANLAMRDALKRQQQQDQASLDTIVGATLDVEHGEGYAVPPIRLGDIQVHARRMTFNDFYIFKHWQLLNEPVLLIGMDTLGLLDVLIIDYRRRELHVKVRS